MKRKYSLDGSTNQTHDTCQTLQKYSMFRLNYDVSRAQIYLKKDAQHIERLESFLECKLEVSQSGEIRNSKNFFFSEKE